MCSSSARDARVEPSSAALVMRRVWSAVSAATCATATATGASAWRQIRALSGRSWWSAGLRTRRRFCFGWSRDGADTHDAARASVRADSASRAVEVLRLVWIGVGASRADAGVAARQRRRTGLVASWHAPRSALTHRQPARARKARCSSSPNPAVRLWSDRALRRRLCREAGVAPCAPARRPSR